MIIGIEFGEESMTFDDDDDDDVSFTVPENCKQLNVSIGVTSPCGIESDVMSASPTGVDVICLVTTFWNNDFAG